jgi:DNA-binding transcriptional ArsR family regulator
LDAVFAALADPTRRRIVERLSRKPLSISDIASEFPLSQPAISKHIRVLEEAGLLKRTIAGRVHYCTASPQGMQKVASWVERQRREWDDALDRLDRVLSTPSHEKRKP